MRAHGTYRYSAGAASSALGSGGRAFRPAAPIRFSAAARANGPPAWLRPDRLPAMKGRAMPVNRAIRAVMGMTAAIKLGLSMASGLLMDLAGGRRSGRIGGRRRRPAGWLADLVIAAVRVHHDPPGFPAVQFLLASPGGQRVADDPGEQERQYWPGQHEHPEYPGDRVEIQVQVVGDLVVGGRGPQQPVEREAGHTGRGAVREVGWRGRQQPARRPPRSEEHTSELQS